MSEKILINIHGLSFWVGLLLLLGTFGAADLDQISVGAFIVQIVIGLFLTIFGWLGFQETNEGYPY